jgi:hypothetical protein
MKYLDPLKPLIYFPIVKCMADFISIHSGINKIINTLMVVKDLKSMEIISLLKITKKYFSRHAFFTNLLFLLAMFVTQREIENCFQV